MKNSKILHRLLIYFAAALLLFSLVTGAIFIPLLQAQTVKDYKSYMESQAISIASAMTEFMTGTSATPNKNTTGTGSGGLGAYLRFVDDIAMADVWIIDKDMNLITGYNQDAEVLYKDLPENADQVVQQAFLGTTTFSEEFSSVLDTPTLTIGTPILSGETTLGIVLLHAPVAGMQDITWQSVKLLALSTIVALVLSALLATFLALSFTKPLEKIKNTALQLSEGDYKARACMNMAGEIGELGDALDILADRLTKAREESARLDKMRQDFVANISHELNTPVTVIRGSLEAIQDGVVTNPLQIREYHNNMLKESISLQRLVKDLLELSRLQNTDFSIEMQDLNLREPLNDAINCVMQLAEEKNISLDLQTDTNAVQFKGDYGRLRQMFIIILDNAVKFSPPKSTIHVTLSQGVVTIRDTGFGILEADLPYIFDRFYRAKSPDNTKGSGLGLAIAKQIADRHGITVFVSSKVDQGTSFEFNLHPQNNS
jgi:signal transduction histidine kinase